MITALVWAAVVLLGGGEALANGIFLNGVRVNGLKNQNFEECKVVFDATGNVHITADGFKVHAVPQGGQAAAAPAQAPTPAPAQPQAVPGQQRVVNQPPPPKTVPPMRYYQPTKPVPTAPPPRMAPAQPVAPPPPKPAAAAKAPEPTPTHLTRKYYLVAMSSRPGYVQYDVDIYFNGTWVKKIRNRDRQVVVEVTDKLKPGKNAVHFAATKNMDGKPRLSTSSSDFMRVILGSGHRGGGTVSITENFAEFKVSAAKVANFGNQTEVTLK